MAEVMKYEDFKEEVSDNEVKAADNKAEIILLKMEILSSLNLIYLRN